MEAARNCDPSLSEQINPKHLESNFLNNIKVSYVSHGSFFENKHGFSEQDLSNGIPTLLVKNKTNLHVPQNFYQKFMQGLTRHNSFTFDIQVRGFKTDRNIKSELERNPNLVARLKNSLGFTSPENLESKLAKDLAVGNEKMKQIISAEGNMSDAEKQRIKVAFAEGYLLANGPGGRPGKAARYFKILQQFLVLVVFLAVIVTLMVSTTGSIFR